MSILWRALLAVLLLGGPAVWFPWAATDAAAQSSPVTHTHGPLAEVNDNDPDELCRSGNPRKRKKCRYNGWDQMLLENDNGQSAEVADDTPLPVDVVTVDGLTVELTRTAESPTINTPFVVAVKGDGASIERVSWWVQGPVPSGPFVDDLAFSGTMSFDCAGSQPCAWSWPVVARYPGPYVLHATVRDTSGREVQTAWTFETVEN